MREVGVAVMQATGERSAIMESVPAVSPGIERVLTMLAQQPPRADILEPFVQAARDVIAQECGSDVMPGKLSITNSTDTALDVTVVIGITGRLTGIAIYGMSEEMATALVGKMMGGPISELDDMAISGIAEMANVITGHATTLLTAMGLHWFGHQAQHGEDPAAGHAAADEPRRAPGTSRREGHWRQAVA
jgi:CheY-specific phosphatase CheX